RCKANHLNPAHHSTASRRLPRFSVRPGLPGCAWLCQQPHALWWPQGTWFECAKLLLELDESTETAVEVLHSLVEEDDTNPDVWQLLSLALYSGHQYEEALEAIVRGQSLMRRMRVPRADPHWAGFEELAAAVKDAMGQEAAALGEAGIKGTA
ncbi:TPR_REGION domain-containing protein, partial [Haematococcus lacustris]